MAQFALSRVAFVTPIPRQEDFLIDFFCVLADKDDATGCWLDYPKNAFFVQVKSKGDRRKGLTLKQSDIHWISHHMDHPLLICWVDKEKQEIGVYSCARLWMLLFLRHDPEKVHLIFGDSPLATNGVVVDEKSDLKDWPVAPKMVRVYLGKPILSQTLSEIESNDKTARDVLGAWLDLDADNAARRRLGRAAVCHYLDWETNVVPQGEPAEVLYVCGETEKLERETRRNLKALGETNQKRPKSPENTPASDALLAEILASQPDYLGNLQRESDSRTSTVGMPLGVVQLVEMTEETEGAKDSIPKDIVPPRGPSR